jgi:cytidylate kinase
MKNRISIAIDGPVAGGKGTVAKGLSRRLNIPTLNTGAIYRGVTVAQQIGGIDINDEKQIIMSLSRFDLRVFVANGETKIFLNNKDISDKIFNNTVSIAVPIVSSYISVRDYVNQKIAEIAVQGDFIVEGRDIGTVVLPNAKYKFFLTADINERAKRRAEELTAKGENISFDEILSQIKERDETDMNHKVGPLRRSPDAILIDSTGMTPEQVIDKMINIIKLK